MGFDSAEHDQEVAEQAKIAQEIVVDQPAPVEEPHVAGETADDDDAASLDADDTVTVYLVEDAEVDGEPVTHCRIAGVVIEPEGTEVPLSVALQLVEDANVVMEELV